ncbi:MAG: hypothetical protein KIY11_05835 [Thermoplasmata archaeon]|nr:hypothetical protein [Candidatus Sysuiplasma acidicola]
MHRHDFDFKFRRTIDRKFRNEMLAVRSVLDAESVVFLGQFGVGSVSHRPDIVNFRGESCRLTEKKS